mgnify:FL=1
MLRTENKSPCGEGSQSCQGRAQFRIVWTLDPDLDRFQEAESAQQLPGRLSAESISVDLVIHFYHSTPGPFTGSIYF